MQAVSRIETKAEMYALRAAGRLGNCGVDWACAHEAVAWLQQAPGERGVVRTYRPGGPCHWDLTAEELWAVCRSLDAAGERYQLSLRMPDHLIQFRGYLMRSERGLLLEYSEVPGIQMREAMRNPPKRLEGLAASAYLRGCLTEYDWDDLNRLLDEWPGAVVEMTCYRMEVGTLPGRRAVIWEVRDY